MNSQNFIFIDTFMDIYNFTITAFSNFPNYGIWWDDAIAHAHRNLFGINYYQVLSFYILQVFVGGLQQSGSTQCRPLITCTTTAWVKQQVWVTPTTADNIHRSALCQRAETLAFLEVCDEPLYLCHSSFRVVTNSTWPPPLWTSNKGGYSRFWQLGNKRCQANCAQFEWFEWLGGSPKVQLHGLNVGLRRDGKCDSHLWRLSHHNLLFTTKMSH